MSQLALHPYSLSGALLVCHNMLEWERGVLEAIEGEPFDAEKIAQQTYHMSEFKWLAVDEQNQPHIVGGFNRVRSGVCRTWFYTTPEAWSKHYRSTTRIARGLIEQMAQSFHRVETVTLAGNSPLERWYGKIGLTYEATLRSYGAAFQDAVVYARVS